MKVKCVTTVPFRHPVPPIPQFDVSSREKLPNMVATRGDIFSLKFTKYCLAAGLLPDPLEELKRSPSPLAAIRGLLFRERKGKGGEGKRAKRSEKLRERRKKGREGRLMPPDDFLHDAPGFYRLRTTETSSVAYSSGFSTGFQEEDKGFVSASQLFRRCCIARCLARILDHECNCFAEIAKQVSVHTEMFCTAKCC